MTTTDNIHEVKIPDRIEYDRDEKLALIEIDCSNAHNVMLPDGTLVPRGVTRMRVPEKHLALIESTYVQTEGEKADLKTAIAQHERDFTNHLETALANYVENGFVPGSIDYERRKEELTATWPGSVSGTHTRLFHRDMKPFASLRLLEKGLVNSQDVARVEAEKNSVSHIAEAITGVTGKGQNASAESQANMIAEVVAQVLTKMGHGAGAVAASKKGG